jgi:hypothetical protein
MALVAVGVITLLLGPYRQILGAATGSPSVDRPDPCLPGTAVPIMRSPHIAQAVAASVHYNSDPPTSGPHAAFSAPPGIYPAPVPDLLAVHALEHGHVVIQYGSAVPAEVLAELKHVAKVFANDTVLAPRPSLGREVALTAWGRIDRFTKYDERRTLKFVERLRGRYDHGWTGPEPCPSPTSSYQGDSKVE